MNKFKSLIMIIVFIICLALIIIGQRNISGTGLAMELAGLAGFLTILYIYNRQFK